MKRLQVTKHKLLVSINGEYNIVVDSPLSSITKAEHIPTGLYFGYYNNGPKVGVMSVNEGIFAWIGQTVTTVDVTSVSSEIIG